ncbi:MAG: hypothetical protein Q9217_000490 [Psora testacea]
MEMKRSYICYDSDGIKSIGDFLNKTIGPTYTYNIRLDEDPSADQSATFFGNLTDEVQTVCTKLAQEPILSKAKGINAIGFSQGGQFMRAYVERCNDPPVKNLVTFGSQHNGITDFQNCNENSWNPLVCAAWDSILKSQTWTNFVQSRLVPAQYFRDPEDMENYLTHSNFLADVNNERDRKNVTYKENMKKLERFVMYMFSDDTTVVPKETAYFDEVIGTGDEAKITKLKDREIYKEDWLGLKDLDQSGRLEFRVAEGGHMQISDELLRDVIEIMYGG